MTENIIQNYHERHHTKQVLAIIRN